MKLTNKKVLEKLKRKNLGNLPLANSINKLINDIEVYGWEDEIELHKIRPDADCFHSDGFYFFNLNIHRQ